MLAFFALRTTPTGSSGCLSGVLTYEAASWPHQQLGAETLWLLYLFVSKRQMGPTAKRERIAQIWPASAGDLPCSPLLSDETLAGIAKPGAAFMTKMPDELGYLLSVLQSFKQLSKEGRKDLLRDPWHEPDTASLRLRS